MQYDHNKRRLRAELAVLNAEILNDALSEMTQDFEHALKEDRVAVTTLTRQEAMRYLRSAVERLYGPALSD